MCLLLREGQKEVGNTGKIVHTFAAEGDQPMMRVRTDSYAVQLGH
jgi:hypothetical protein